MTRSGPPSALPEQDYEAIEEAVMETARGRWFLSEFARRNRTADTDMLLQAIAKLQNAIGDQSSEAGISKFRKDLLEMADAIAQTKREIAAMRPTENDDGHIGEATLELDAIVESAEKATSEILFAAEQVQEIAWSARESGTSPAVCNAIDIHVTEIYTACSFQDLTGQRTQKVVKALRFIENRISAMVNIWNVDDLAATPVVKESDARPDAHLLNGPQLAGRGKSQDEINSLMQQEVDLDDVTFANADDQPALEAQTLAHTVEDADFVAEGAADEAEVLPDRGAEEPFDLNALEQAADNAVALPPSQHFTAYPHDEIVASADESGAVEAVSDAIPETAELQSVRLPVQPESDGPIVVPTLHELVFALETPEGERGGDKAAQAAFGAIAGHIERAVGAQQQPKQMAQDMPGEDLASLTANQRIVLFS